MKLDQLPVEMLMHIFSYLSEFEEVSLVNKLFYNIVCKMNDSNICLRIDNGSDFQSMLLSNRDISHVEIDLRSVDNRELREVISVVEKFSIKMKFLTLKGYWNKNFLQEVLSFTPNIEYLELRCLRFEEPLFTQRVAVKLKELESVAKRWYGILRRNQPEEGQLCKNELNLTKLKSLKITCWNDVFNEFVRLPVGILTELKIAFFNWNKLAALINRQPNIKKLIVECDRDDDFGMDVIGELTLESLEVDGFKLNSVPVVAILSKQTKLKSLILMGEEIVDEVVMHAVANNFELEKLAMNVTEIPPSSFVQIRNLKKLKDLKLQWTGQDLSDSTAKLKTLAESDNTSMETLSLQWNIQISVDSIERLSKSAPNLKHLKIVGYCRRQSRSQLEIDAILRHFNCVKKLKIPIVCEPLPVRLDYYNPSLRELALLFTTADLFYEQWLPKLIFDYPNLKKLKVIIKECPNCKLGPILDGFQKLETLILRIESYRVVFDDLNYLYEHKNKLQYVRLRPICHGSLPDDVIQKLRTKFPVINQGSEFTMAVDRYVMNRERRVWSLSSPSMDTCG